MAKATVAWGGGVGVGRWGAEGVNGRTRGSAAPGRQIARQLRERRGVRTRGFLCSSAGRLLEPPFSHLHNGSHQGPQEGERSPAAPTRSMAALRGPHRSLTALGARPVPLFPEPFALLLLSPPRARYILPGLIFKAPGLQVLCLLWVGAPAGQMLASHGRLANAPRPGKVPPGGLS